MNIAYAVMEQQWSGYIEAVFVPDPDGPVEVTQDDRRYRARREAREVPPAFTAEERACMEARGVVVLHRTYSLQQQAFREAGFELGPPAPGAATCAAVLGVDLVVCIGTEDRYGIVPPDAALRRYPTVEAWRESTDACATAPSQQPANGA